MTDLIESGSAWLAGVMQSHASQAVTLKRGAAATADVKATIGSTEFTQETSEGLVTRHESRDYLIDVADYVVSGSAVEPAKGDRIEETDAGGTTHVYQVSGFGDEPHFRFSDRYHSRYRVHTKKVA